ncbi:MAG: GNAT family N-acetyltransferase [Rhodocyclaceae bacterium]
MTGGEWYRVRDVGDAAVEDLCGLFATVFHKAVEPAAWRWKYQDAALSGHVNVVLEGEGGILGHAGAVILPGVFDGEPVPIAQVCDVMLSPDARGGAGPRGAYATFMNGLIAALQSRIPQGMFYGFPGERPFRLGERLGFYRGTGRIHEYVIDARPSHARLWRLCRLDWADARIDARWRDAAGRPGCRLVRDRRYLDWRYARNPHRPYLLIGVRSGLALSGWLVLHRAGEEMWLVDHGLEDAALQALLPALRGWVHARGARRLVWWQGDLSAEGVPAGAQARDTGMVGVVMPSSAARFAACQPAWQPGDTDVR